MTVSIRSAKGFSYCLGLRAFWILQEMELIVMPFLSVNKPSGSDMSSFWCSENLWDGVYLHFGLSSPNWENWDRFKFRFPSISKAKCSVLSVVL